MKLRVPEKTGDSRQDKGVLSRFFFPQKKANQKLFYNNLNKYNFSVQNGILIAYFSK
jgi:hypothetical protein